MLSLVRDEELCVDRVLSELGGGPIVLATPLGIGKPNALLNALYRRAKREPRLSLEIITALSLNPPLGKSELEERFFRPIRQRVWGDYPRLEFLDDRAQENLPSNVRVLEFYMQSGSVLDNAHAQQNHLSNNYTHVARTLMNRGVNLAVQALALRETPEGRSYSLSSNPDVALELAPLIRESGRKWLGVGQVNRRLPWFGGAAEVAEDGGGLFQLMLDHPRLDHEPFSVPHEPVGSAEWAIGLHAAQLVRDGGTLQVGIGALGDAVCHSLRLRHTDPASFSALLEALDRPVAPSLSPERGRFERGLYVASELISGPIFALFEAGIVRRRVFESEQAQRAANADPNAEAGMAGGSVMQGAFFLGSADFYQRLRDLSSEQLSQIDMTSVAEVNRIYTHYTLERLQRGQARFLNVAMKATLLGSAISDQLRDGRVVSGVGGQPDFVNMAHQLPDGRSVIMLKATRGQGDQLTSNILWEYPHATVLRPMRDVFVTEYGVADLRGKTDGECCQAMLAITDSRFQDALLRRAKRARKLPKDYRLPDVHRQNVPERVTRALESYERSGALPRLPFGSDLTPAEWRLSGRLKRLAKAIESWPGRLSLMRALVQVDAGDGDEVRFALSHLALEKPTSLLERELARLVRAAHRL